MGPPFSAWSVIRASELARARHRPEQRRVVDHVDAGVGHEQLERGDPRRDEVRHVREDTVVDLLHHHVEAVVDVRVSGRLRVPAREPVREPLAVVVPGVVDDGRRPTPRRRRRARREVVRGDAERCLEVEVRVGVDRARDHVAAGGVDRLVGRAQVGADGRHVLTDDEHVGARGVGGGHHGAAADQRRHATPSAAGDPMLSCVRTRRTALAAPCRGTFGTTRVPLAGRASVARGRRRPGPP